MADPITIGLGALMAVGTLASAGAQASQGQVAQDIAYQNAQQYENRANQVQDEAAARARIVQRDNERKMATARAAYGASGVDVNTGTPLDVMADQATEAELQRQLYLYEGNANAFNLRGQADLIRKGGTAAYDAARTGAFTTLLTGAAKGGMLAYQAGAFGSSSSPKIPTTGPGTGYTY